MKSMIHFVPFSTKLISDWTDSSHPRYYLDTELYRWLDQYVGHGYPMPIHVNQAPANLDWGWDWLSGLNHPPVFYTRKPRSAVLFKLTWGGR